MPKQIQGIWHLLQLLLLIVLLPSSLTASTSVRQRTLIDSGWLYMEGDHPGAEARTFDDRSWQSIGLPHSFGLPYFGASNFYVGYGWYRRHLHIGQKQTHRISFLEFEAAFQDAEVFVNGRLVGRHQGGYTGFSLDVTQALAEGDNVIAMQLNNKWNAQLNPRAGEHNFNGGIYRNVYLVTTADLHVDWYGTYVTTPGLSAAGSPVHIATDIRNDSASQRSFTLRTDILDGAGHQVSSVQSTESIGPGATLTIQQQTPFIARPALWSPAHPAMYTAVSHVLEDSHETDSYTTPFGFRWTSWTAEQGFFLNGEHFYFHGADVHQDHAGWGDGVTNAGIARDVRLVKDAGMDFIRGSHYPHSPVFADECDRQGILFWAENSFWGTGGAKQEGNWTASAYPPNEQDQSLFEESVERSLAEMVRINRNHPSIIAWSMGNEVFFSDSDLLPKIRIFLKTLVDETHRLDPTRPAAIGGVQRGDIDKIGDVAGYNGDGAKLFLDPGVPNAVTEYGSTESDRPGEYAPGFGDLEGQPEFAWRGGQAIWCAFDHGSIFANLGRTGMIDYFRLPKRTWYWYRNAYRGISPPEWPQPGDAVALRLEADKPATIRADGSDDVQLIVTVRGADGSALSNSPPVKLEIVSGPGEFPTGRTIEFATNSDIAIRDGEAAIEMRSYQSGMIVVRASSVGLKPAELKIRATGGPDYVAGVTPLTPERAYVQRREQPVASDSVVDLSLNRPTDSSSNMPGHSSRFANDGDAKSFWQPASSSASFWQVDLEGRCSVSDVKLVFTDSKGALYSLQLSEDGVHWKTIRDRLSARPSGEEDTESLPQGSTARFLRVASESKSGNSPLRLAEITVLGRPL
jgi:hypothetical protein